MKSMTLCLAGLVACGGLWLGGCTKPVEQQTVEKSNLTPGMVKLKIVKGQTSQTEIVEVFGPPDLVTHKDDVDIWTYDKTNYDYQKDSGYITILLAGTGGDRVRTSSKSTMLIVYFDKADRVVDYRLSAIKY